MTLHTHQALGEEARMMSLNPEALPLKEGINEREDDALKSLVRMTVWRPWHTFGSSVSDLFLSLKPCF